MSQHYLCTCDRVSLRNIWGICKDYETTFSEYLKCYLFLKSVSVWETWMLPGVWTSCDLELLNNFVYTIKITPLVLFFCDILAVSKHSVPVTEGAFLFGCVAGFPLLFHWAVLFLAAKWGPYFQTFECRHQGHCQILKWFSVTLSMGNCNACLHQWCMEGWSGMID